MPDTPIPMSEILTLWYLSAIPLLALGNVQICYITVSTPRDSAKVESCLKKLVAAPNAAMTEITAAEPK
jgi:hypothetical protein